jgi:GcrA cell cycle regulator
MISWTDERVEVLKRLWSDGLSASQIAGELGGVTRNAVIGKVHRLGLSGRAKAPATQAQRPKKPTAPILRTTPVRPMTLPLVHGNVALRADHQPAPQPRAETQPKIYALSDAPLIDNASILQLNEQTCKWPVGDPGQDGFHFCARRSDSGIPYCAYHARMAYQPISERRREKRAVGSY